MALLVETYDERRVVRRENDVREVSCQAAVHVDAEVALLMRQGWRQNFVFQLFEKEANLSFLFF